MNKDEIVSLLVGVKLDVNLNELYFFLQESALKEIDDVMFDSIDFDAEDEEEDNTLITMFFAKDSICLTAKRDDKYIGQTQYVPYNRIIDKELNNLFLVAMPKNQSLKNLRI